MEQHPATPETSRWWHSRNRRANLLFVAMAAGSVIVWLSMDIQFGWLWPACCLGYLLVEWVWFRFFDPAYPNHDLNGGDSYAGPPTASLPREAWQGALAAAGILGLIVLAIWLA